MNHDITSLLELTSSEVQEIQSVENKTCTVIQITRRYICPQCGKTVAEDNPLSDKNTNISDLTIEIVLKMLKDYSNTFSAITRNNDLSPL